MKEFIMKHPFITFVIIEDVLTVVQNIALGRKHSRTLMNVAADCGMNVADEMRKEIEKKKKEPIGFHFTKEES